MAWQLTLAWVVFVAVCGFIAYWGDLLGRRMGKRRLSLFGLRPRYTAIVTTTITGMLIALLAIVSMTMVNERFRLFMLDGERVISYYETAKKQLADSKRQLDDSKRQLGLQTEIAEKARKDAGLAEARRRKIVRTLQVVANELKRNQSALLATKRMLASAHVDLATARRQVASYRVTIAQLTARRDGLQKKVDDLGKQIGVWETSYSGMRTKKVIFQPGQEIARSVIVCSQTKSEIRKSFISLLNQASRKAAVEGARVGPNGRTVYIINKIVPTINDRGQKLSEAVVESQIVDVIVDQISNSSGSVVARIYSKSNAFEGEPAAVDCEPIRNQLVYSAGEEVIRTVIDGSGSRGKILGELTLFLQSDVRYAARSKGLIPTYGDDGQPSVGAIAYDDVLDAVDRIKKSGKKMRVKAFAASTTWSAGPLELYLVVSDAS